MENNKKKKKLSIVLAAVLILAALAVTALIGKPLISFVADTEGFRAFVDGHAISSRLIFLGMTSLQVLLAFIPGEPLELAAGYAFGALEGTFLCILGLCAGSMLVFMLTRKFGLRFVHLFFSQEKIDSLALMKNPKRLFLITAVLMVLPGTPKDLLTYCAGLTNISPMHWLLISTVGRIPSVITSTLCADAIATRDFGRAAIVFGITALLSIIGFFVFAQKSHWDGSDTKKKGSQPS